MNKLLLVAIMVGGVAVAGEDTVKKYQDIVQRWGWQVEPQALGRLGRLQEKFAQEKNLSDLHPVIELTAKSAFNACCITEPILTLQDEHSTNSACYPLVDEDYYPVKAMAIGVGDETGSNPLPLIRHSIFHECGHIVAGDVDQNADFKDWPFVLGHMALSTYAGRRVATALPILPRSGRLLAGITAGVAVGIGLGRLYNKTVQAYQTRKIERRADIFAIKKLIELNDFYAVAYSFVDCTCNVDEGNTNWKNEYGLFHDHPGYLERAKIILDELKHAGIDLEKLPLDKKLYDGSPDTPAVLDEKELQKRCTKQVAKHFPRCESRELKE